MLTRNEPIVFSFIFFFGISYSKEGQKRQKTTTIKNKRQNMLKI